MSLVPTLTLWGYELRKSGESPAEIERYNSVAASQVLLYQRAGGQLLFGTDVGYMTEYDPTEEFSLLARAGLTSMQILAMLTTAPAARFGESATRGTIATGMDGDLVVLSGDPAQDPRNFARVRYTIRAGRVIYPVPGN
jgi:imidazolonepropionase-like amidohydrolase